WVSSGEEVVPFPLIEQRTAQLRLDPVRRPSTPGRVLLAFAEQLGARSWSLDPPTPVTEIDEGRHCHRLRGANDVFQRLAQLLEPALDVAGHDPGDSPELVEPRACRAAAVLLDDVLDALAKREACLRALVHHQLSRGPHTRVS